MAAADPRLEPPIWRTPRQWRALDAKIARLIPVSLGLSVWYFSWLLRPSRVGDPVLYGLLVLAEVFNFVQAVGFWWTAWRGRGEDPPVPPLADAPPVDVLIPVYDEPIEVVEPTVAAAVALEGAPVRVVLCDDAGRAELEALAERHGATYVHRSRQTGAKAGNLNHALTLTSAPLVAVFDCDHVPRREFLRATLGHFADPSVAYVQTPQYYANVSANRLAAAAASQQNLFFGTIARGKARLGGMFCCGTNFVIRRQALEGVGGFPEGSLTEDFTLSIRLHELGWRSAYVNEVLALGLGPEDMAS
jgi:cellulose synthase (UDP-forming)